MIITGRTRVVGVIGDPVGHSLSPIMHNTEFMRLGLDYVYVPWRVASADLAAAVAGFRAQNVAGFNITIPHKQAVIPLLDEVDERAVLVGAVNTVLLGTDGHLKGFNTDVRGWTGDIERRLERVPPAKAVRPCVFMRTSPILASGFSIRTTASPSSSTPSIRGTNPSALKKRSSCCATSDRKVKIRALPR